MVGIITAIKTNEECDCCFVHMARATCTTIVITNAWIAMVTKLTPPPTKNCRNMLNLPARFVIPSYHAGWIAGEVENNLRQVSE
jgi:hypothetical protein